MDKIKKKFISDEMTTDVELAAAIAGVQAQMSTLTVPFSFSDLPLPTGAATEAAQVTTNTLLADIDTKVSGTIKVDGSAVTQPISGTVAISNFPTEPTSMAVTNFPATQVVSGTIAVSNQPTSIEVSNFPLTQPISGSVTVTNFPSEPTSVAVNNFPASQAVTGTFWQATQPISGTVAVSNQPTSIQVSNFPATQPVSLASVPTHGVTGTFWQAIQPVTVVDGQKATYSACITGLVTATTPTDVFTISGSATKTIKITRLGFTGLQTTSALRDIVLLKRSTANTGGTSTAPVAVSYDSNNAAATAVVTAYTANPTALGTLVGNMRSYKYPLDANPTGTSAVPSTPVEWMFGDKGGQAITLRGATQLFCVNLNSVTSTGDSLDIFVEWTEE